MKCASLLRLGNGADTASVALALTFSLALVAHSARANCFDEAAAYHHVNANVLRAIAWQESHNQPAAKHLNENGSVDYGVMQINSIHLRTLSQFGVNASALMEPCKNVYIAARHLRTQIDHYGNTWAAARLRRLTRDAFELLNHDPQDARYAYADGMLLVEGALVAVTPTSIGSYHGGTQQPGVLISAEAGYRFSPSTAPRAGELLPNASTLLATYGAAIGCNAQGWIMLHRALATQHLQGVTLAAEIVATRRMQRLLVEPTLGSDTDQAGVRAGATSTG